MRKIFTLILLSMLSTVGYSQLTQTPIQLPGQSGTFGSNVRGFWFQSPTCFTLTGAWVPNTANSGNQSIAIIRLPAAPPAYSNTTNTFDVLFLKQDTATNDTFDLNIQIEQGDFIGVLGQRGTTNSYGTSPYTTAIGTFPVTLTRMGMQFALTTTPPQQIWTESGGSISRVQLFYDLNLNYNISSSLTGNTASLSVTADTSFTVNWDFGDGNTGTGSNVTHTYVPGQYTACAYITNTCGTDTVCTPINLCAPPVTNFGSSTSGLTVSFSDSTQGAVSYFWDFGDGNVDSVASPTHTYASTGTYTACLITQSVCGAYDTLCTTVMPCAVPVANFGAFNITVDTVQFQDSSMQASSWFWDFGDGNTSTLQSPTHVYTANGQYTACLTVTNACGSDTMCTNVNVCLFPPTAGFTFNQTGLSVTFSDNSVSAANWSWDFGDGGTAVIQNPSHTYQAAGTYVVCLTVTDVCANGNVICDTITVCAPPTASFTSSSAAGGIVTFTNTTLQGTSYSWDFGDGNSSTQASPTHTYAAAGSYYVCMTADNGCDTDTYCDSVQVVIIGIDDIRDGQGYTLFPNPFTDRSILRVEAATAGEFELQIFDMKGALLRTESGFYNQDLVIERKDLSSGMYLLRVISDGELRAKGRFLVE